MNQELISIIVPIYNVESYVEKCIDSLTTQTYGHLEIILVDDGSTDSSPAICDTWAARDSRITVIHKENGGLSDARNTGIEAAHGDFLMLVDGDDYILPMACERLQQIAQECDADMVIANFLYVYPDGAHKYYRPEMPHQCVCYTGEEALVEYFKTFRLDFMIAPNKLYRRALFFEGECIRFPLGRLGEDTHTSYRILYAASRIAVTSEIFYYYVQRPGSIMAQYGEKFVRDTIACAKQYLIWAADKSSDVKMLSERGCLFHFFSLHKKIYTLGIGKKVEKEMSEFYDFIKRGIRGIFHNKYIEKRMWIKYLIYRARLYPLFLRIIGLYTAVRHLKSL